MNYKLFCLILLIAVLTPSINSQNCFVDSYYNVTTESCNPCPKSVDSSTCGQNTTCISYYWFNDTVTAACQPIPVCGTGSWFNATSGICVECTSFVNELDCFLCPGFGFNFSNNGKCQAPAPCSDFKFYDFNSTTCAECNGTGSTSTFGGNISTICGMGACQSHFWALTNTTIVYLNEIINITELTCYACSMIANTLPGGLPINSTECACNLGFFWNGVNLTCDSCESANDTTCFLCDNYVLYNSASGIKCSLCANIPNSNGGYNPQTGTCNCAIGFTWSVANKNCSLCKDGTSEFECLTASCLGFYFANNICGACGDIVGTVAADNENTPPSKECVCDLNTIWFAENGTAPTCAVCNTAGASVNGTKCGKGSCINYIYSLANDSCVDNCSDVLNYNPDYPTIINGGCICMTAYFFSAVNFTCDVCASAVDEASCKIQTCSDYWWDKTKSICITCDNVTNADITVNMTNGVCTCLVGYLWNTTTKKCDSCSTADSNNCGYVGCASYFYKTSTKKCIKCPTIANPKTPNISNTVCDCPTLTIWSPNTISCVACDVSVGKALNNVTGYCVDCKTLLNKKIMTNESKLSKINQCLCASNYTFINGKCSCNATKLLFDMGGSAGCGTCPQISGGNSYNNTTGGCNCISAASWNNLTKKCVCSKAGDFLNGKSCVACSSLGTGLATASNGADPFACICSTNLTWNSTLKTCICTDKTTFWNNVSVTCDSCSKAVYYSKGTSNGPTSCACNDNMIWDAKTKTCICDTKSIPKGTSKLYCIACSNVIGSSGAKAGAIGCVCKAGWTWNAALQMCTCTTTSCQCPTDFVLINKICTNCSTIIGSTGKASSNLACACKKSFVWNTTNNNCTCPKGGMTNSAGSICTFCDVSANAFNYTTAAKTACNCTTNYRWDGLSLTCKFIGGDAKIMLTNGTKKSCAGFGGSQGSSLDNFNCRCFAGSVWNPITSTCVNCNTIQYTNTTGTIKNNNYSCICLNGTSWDVLTFTCKNNTCKFPISDSRCGYCLIASGVEQVPQLLSVSLKTDTFQLSGDNEYIAAMNAQSKLYSNYVSVKCKCRVGYAWNVARRLCFNATLNATY